MPDRLRNHVNCRDIHTPCLDGVNSGNLSEELFCTYQQGKQKMRYWTRWRCWRCHTCRQFVSTGVDL